MTMSSDALHLCYILHIQQIEKFRAVRGTAETPGGVPGIRIRLRT
ncbi:Uncharacterized protein dnm_048270 [Desulfonema magnum]|uniref:Uncharacterized protein n=1 Tax=Desulfonema magnum TaxID=45655 RepID=A0A975BPP2_9BACT|nr:Uncharacterized protein dnm_048270 [Desulfonema magnum]